MMVDAFTRVSALWFGEGFLDFWAICRLGFVSRYFHAEFERTVHVCIDVGLHRLLSFTLPRNTRSVNLRFFNSIFITPKVLEWWLHAILATASLENCQLSCGTIYQLHWTLVCQSIYRFIKERGCDLCVPLHISVDGFRRLGEAPCRFRFPDELPWVVQMAYWVFHVSSRVTICSQNFEITKDWLVSQLAARRRRSGGGDPWLAAAEDITTYYPLE